MVFLTNWTVIAPPRLGEARRTCGLEGFEELMWCDCPRAAVQDGRYRGHSITEQLGLLRVISEAEGRMKTGIGGGQRLGGEFTGKWICSGDLVEHWSGRLAGP
jgi:hypothetical protein